MEHIRLLLNAERQIPVFSTRDVPRGTTVYLL